MDVLAIKNKPVRNETIVLLDFAAQYSQLLARKIRGANVYCKVLPPHASKEEILVNKPKGIILSGGFNPVNEAAPPKIDEEIFKLNLPILGIAGGALIMSRAFGGRQAPLKEGEYFKGEISVSPSRLFKGVDAKTRVWMINSCQAQEAPGGFNISAFSANCPVLAIENEEKSLYGVFFHPESDHTLQGDIILKNFLFDICGCKGDWEMASFIRAAVEDIKKQVGEKSVLLGLSGGVDSAVAAALIHKAVGDQLICVFVNHGLLRKNEQQEVVDVFRPRLGDNLIVVDASQRFLSKLAGVTDPESKRKIIGREFIEVFGETARSLGKLDYLAQGTIYPDVIESGGGGAAVIKSHHNVGGLPKDLPFCGIVEPLRYLFKDEVRKVGEELGLPKDMVWRQPFPGPGLGIRVIGEITRDKLEILKEADAILRQEIALNGLTASASQYFAVLTGLKSVGIMGEERSYDYTIALRVVNTSDFMAAEWVRLPYEVMDKISKRIANEVPHVNRVVYDITSKPPASIEWE